MPERGKYFLETTKDELRELLELAGRNKGRISRSYGWLIEWTQGRYTNISGVPDETSRPATAANVIRYFKYWEEAERS